MIIINLQNEHLKKNYFGISNLLREEIEKSLQINKKIVLFHNRKGFAKRVLCKNCKNFISCPQCANPLILTKNKEMFCCVCSKPSSVFSCVYCNSSTFIYSGFGLQKIAHSISHEFNGNAKIMESHTLSSWILSSQNTSIFLSTIPPRMDVPVKKINFNIGVAAIINADTDMYLPDYTAHVRLYNRIQSFLQFAKTLFVEHTIIQTFSPNLAALQLAVARKTRTFIKNELQERKEQQYPPYITLIKLLYQHPRPDICKQKAQEMYFQLKTYEQKRIHVTPAQETFIPKVRKNYRYQILIKIQKNENSKSLLSFLKTLPPQWLIDVDPLTNL